MSTIEGRRVAVVGGGLAGIAAALRCADAGCSVTLYEARPRLGGLTHSFRRGDVWVDNGQHVFLRCCVAYQELLDRLGVSDLVTVQPRLDIAVRSARTTGRLRRGSLPAPLHLSASLLRFPWLTPLARVRFVRAALALAAVRADSPEVDDTSFGDWLREQGQDEAAIDHLWDLVGIATLNARAHDASLSLAATVFQKGLLGEASAADIGWSDVPLQELHGDAAMRALAEARVTVALRTKVEGISPSGGRWIVASGGTDAEFDDVVVAAPPDVTEQLIPETATGLAPGWAARLGSTPIVNLHVVVDRVVLDEPFVAAVDSEVQWVFDRTPQSGLADGQYLAVSLSAADALVGRSTLELRDSFLPALKALLPGLRDAEVLDFFVTRERHATFRQAPGSARSRPVTTTSCPGLYLSGAWTSTGWPATMEGAVLSGNAASDALLADSSRFPGREVAA